LWLGQHHDLTKPSFERRLVHWRFSVSQAPG